MTEVSCGLLEDGHWNRRGHDYAKEEDKQRKEDEVDIAKTGDDGGGLSMTTAATADDCTTQRKI